MNQHSGPLVSLLSNGAKKEGGGGAEGMRRQGRAVGHLAFRGDSHWWQRDTKTLCVLSFWVGGCGGGGELQIPKSSVRSRVFGSHFDH